MHAVKQITKVHYYTKNLDLITALKNHEGVWMNFCIISDSGFVIFDIAEAVIIK